MKAEFVDEKVSTSDSMPLGAVRFSAKGSVHLPSASNIEEVIRNGSVRSCPGHSIGRGQGVGTLFEDRFPDVRRAVDPNLLVHYEILNVDVEFDPALVGIGDYERDLAPLSGLDVGDLLVELKGCFGRVGESSRQVELERVELCEGGEIGRARLTLDKDHRRFAQRDRGRSFRR